MSSQLPSATSSCTAATRIVASFLPDYSSEAPSAQRHDTRATPVTDVSPRHGSRRHMALELFRHAAVHLCDDLEIQPGSAYAQAARALRQRVATPRQLEPSVHFARGAVTNSRRSSPPSAPRPRVIAGGWRLNVNRAGPHCGGPARTCFQPTSTRQSFGERIARPPRGNRCGRRTRALRRSARRRDQRRCRRGRRTRLPRLGTQPRSRCRR